MVGILSKINEELINQILNTYKYDNISYNKH